MYCERHTVSLTTADTTEFFATNAAECKLVIHVGQDSTP